MEKQVMDKHEMINYVAVGLLTTIINLSVFYVFDSLLQTHYLLANIISIIVSIMFAFIGNKYIVFTKRNSKQSIMREFFLFIGLRLISGGFDMIILFLLVSMLSVNSTLAKFLTEFIIASSNYVFSKFIIFK